MSALTTGSDPTDQAVARARGVGLSGRLIVLTTTFMLLAEILIYLPSAVSFRRDWLDSYIIGAQSIALALAATPEPNARLDANLRAGLMRGRLVAIRGSGTRWLLDRPGETPPETTGQIDLRDRSWAGGVAGLLRNLVRPAEPAIRIFAPGVAGIPEVDWIEIVADEEPLKRAIFATTTDFLGISLIVAIGTGALLYLALHMMVVRPVRRLSDNIAAFAASPEDAGRVMRPSGRTDEIGRAERALATMETGLAGELRSKRRLAELGLAVSKINHELRNMLTTAQLLGDRLGELEDPTVRRIAPRLVRTLARAIAFSGTILSYGRASEGAPARRRVLLHPIVDEQLDVSALADGTDVLIAVDVPPDLLVDADPDQLGRALHNVMRNAVEALSRDRTPDARLEVSARRADGAVRIRLADNGPGVPDRMRDRLFSAFQASERLGGTGLGLPVADELIRLHGGTIVLEPASRGAVFVLTIPDRA